MRPPGALGDRQGFSGLHPAQDRGGLLVELGNRDRLRTGKCVRIRPMAEIY